MPAAKHAGAVHAGVMASKNTGRKHKRSKRR